MHWTWEVMEEYLRTTNNNNSNNNDGRKLCLSVESTQQRQTKKAKKGWKGKKNMFQSWPRARKRETKCIQTRFIIESVVENSCVLIPNRTYIFLYFIDASRFGQLNVKHRTRKRWEEAKRNTRNRSRIYATMMTEKKCATSCRLL